MSAYSEIISAVIKLVFTLISTVLTIVVVPWLKNTVIPWLKERHYYEVVSNLVKAAEKMARSGAISKDAKKSWVIRMLTRKGYEVNDEISAMIETAVEDLDLNVQSVLHNIAIGVLDDGTDQEEPVGGEEDSDVRAVEEE